MSIFSDRLAYLGINKLLSKYSCTDIISIFVLYFIRIKEIVIQYI